jgi:arginine decarboxylase
MSRNPKEAPLKESQRWSVAESEALYRVKSWGEPYFFVNPEGHVAVRAESERGTEMQIDVMEVVEELRNRGVQFPMLLRFQDILRSQSGV